MKDPNGRGHSPLHKSFAYAFAGLSACLRRERNIKIHVSAAVLVTILGFVLKISATEWCICFLLFGLIMGLELANTAVEAVVDLVTDKEHPLAGYAKDTAAGAVLIAAIFAALIGVIIFGPRLLALVRNLTGL